MIEYPDGMVYHLPNCGIVAMAILAGKPYDHAHEWFRAHMKPRGPWKGRTYHTDYDKYLRHCGVWFNRSVYAKGNQPTIARFASFHAKPGVLYGVRVSGHVMTLRDGWLVDQIVRSQVDEHYARNRRVTHTWEVVA